jgi:hypothetical protein
MYINYKHLLKNNLFLYENDQIKKIFPNADIFLIPNIYTEKDKIISNNFFLKRRFIYLGRINRHKNIHIFIKAFLEAKLKGWNLEIYGINDDNHYKNYILNLIGKNKNILIKKPVFGSKKKKLIKTSWANILISNSEVMSYSVIESSHGCLPSLVLKKIIIKKYSSYIKNFFILKNLDIEELKKSFIKITNLSLTQRLKQGLNIKKFIINEFKPINIFNIYKEKVYLINKVNFNTVVDFKMKKFLFNYIFNNFYLIPLILNLFIPQFIALLLIYKNIFDYIGIYLSVTISLLNLVVMAFSLNSRNEILTNKRKFIYYFYLRIYLSLIYSFFIGYIYSKYYTHLNYLFIILFSFNILLNWVLEVFYYEDKLNNKYNYTLVKLFSDILYLTSTVISILFYENLLLYIFLVYFIFNFLFFILKFCKNISFFNHEHFYPYRAFNYSLYSSITIVLSSFVNKLIIINYFSKNITAILFLYFSIFSFPSTFITYFFSPLMINSFKISNIIYYLKKIILITSYLCFFFLIFYNFVNNFSFMVMIFSFLGGLLLISSSFYRAEVMRFNKKKVFIADILFSYITIFIILLILFINSNLISYYFAITSLISLLIFRYLYFSSKISIGKIVTV